MSADAPLSIADDDFTIAVGDGDAVQLTGDYETVQDLVDAINSKVSGASAWIDSDNHVGDRLVGRTLTIVTANDARHDAGRLSPPRRLPPSTDFLTAISVETAGDANDAMQSASTAALTSVSALR